MIVYFFFQAQLPELIQAPIPEDAPEDSNRKGVVFMKKLFTTNNGLKLIFALLTLTADVSSFTTGTFSGAPGKGNSQTNPICN